MSSPPRITPRPTDPPILIMPVFIKYSPERAPAAAHRRAAVAPRTREKQRTARRARGRSNSPAGSAATTSTDPKCP